MNGKWTAVAGSEWCRVAAPAVFGGTQSERDAPSSPWPAGNKPFRGRPSPPPRVWPICKCSGCHVVFFTWTQKIDLWGNFLGKHGAFRMK